MCNKPMLLKSRCLIVDNIMLGRLLILPGFLPRFNFKNSQKKEKQDFSGTQLLHLLKGKAESLIKLNSDGVVIKYIQSCLALGLDRDNGSLCYLNLD